MLDIGGHGIAFLDREGEEIIPEGWCVIRHSEDMDNARNRPGIFVPNVFARVNEDNFMTLFVAHGRRIPDLKSSTCRRFVLYPSDFLHSPRAEFETYRKVVSRTYRVPTTRVFFIPTKFLVIASDEEFWKIERARAIRVIFGMEEQVLALRSAVVAELGRRSALRRIPRELVREVYKMF